MMISDTLSIFSHLINFTIFLYFIIILLRLDVLDIQGLFISAFGLFASLVVSIIAVIERKYQQQ
jgi:hypothetical protein